MRPEEIFLSHTGKMLGCGDFLAAGLPYSFHARVPIWCFTDHPSPRPHFFFCFSFCAPYPRLPFVRRTAAAPPEALFFFAMYQFLSRERLSFVSSDAPPKPVSGRFVSGC